MLLGIRWNSMRAKIIAWSFVPTAIILMAVAWVTFAAYQHVTEDLVIERNQELTRLSTGEFAAGLAEYTGLLTGYTGLLADLARTAYIYENDPTALQTALTRARDRLRVFDGGVLVINSRGTVVATEPPRPETVGQNWSNRSYFRHMLRSPEPVFSDMVTDGLGGAEVIVVAVPIKGDQGQFLGIISGMFQVGADTPNPFYRDIAMLRIGESESTFLVDGQGRVIYHSDADHIGDDFSAQTVVQQVSEKQIGALRTRDLEGQEIVASFAPVPGTPWGLVTEEGWGKLISPSQGYQRFLLLLLALGVMVPAAVVAIGVKRITKPIIELIAAAQEVAGGNFGLTITAHTGDEVEELAEQFNLMAAQLHESYAHLEQRVDDRTKELAALNAIATSVSGSLALDEMLHDALDKTLHVMEVEAGGIYLLDHQTGTMTIAARRGFGPELADQIDRLKVGEGFSGHVAETGTPLVVKDVSSDPRLTRLAVKELGLRCLASVPLHAKGKVLGTLFTVTRGQHEFSEQDVQLLTSIGHQIGIAVENAQLFAQVEQRMQELEALFSAGAGLHRNLRLDEVLQALVDIAVDILQADKSSVLVWDEKRERLVMRVARGFAPRVLHQLNFARGAGITGHVFVTGEPVIVEDLVSDPRCKGEPAQVLRVLGTQGIRSLMHLPIQVNGEIFGIFNVNWTEPHAFGSHEQRIFLALAQRAALAIENARLLDAERRQRQEATLLAEMAKLISGTLDLDEVLRLTAEYAVDVFSVHCCSMLLFDEQQGTLKPATQIGFSDTAANIICDVEFTPNESMQQTVFEALQPLIIEDAASSPHLSPPEPFDLQSVLVVPIEVGGRRLGAMQLGTQRPKRRRFTADEGELALAMANHAAVAIENARLFKAERRRAEQFRVISEVGRRITSILAVDELLDQMARLVQEIFQYDLVSFGLIEGNEVVFEAGVGPVWNTDQTLRLKLGREGISGWVAQTGQPLLVPDVRNEPRYHFIPQAAETRSELCVPLKTKEAVIGVLDVQSHQLGVFDEIDLAVLQSLADQTAVAIESARLFRDATRQVRELQALAGASRIISSKLDQDQLLQALYEQITRIAPTDFYAIAVYDEATNIVSIEICVDQGVHYPKETYALDKGLLMLIIHNRQPLLFHSLADQEHTLDIEIVHSGSRRVNHGWLGVPMLYGDKVLGAIVVGSYQRGAFDEGHQQTLTSIANQAAVALENARLYEQARQLAVMEERQRLARDLHDAVTQTLFSASLIAEALPALWESNQQDGRQLLQELRQLSRGALAEMRNLLLELRPKTLVEANLGDLLRQLAEAVMGRTGLPVTVKVDGRSALPSDVHVALYRIAQETLNNVVKHAQPSQVTVALHTTRRSMGGRVVELRVTDDGRGFDPQCIPPDRLGLGIIRERAQAVGATLQIESRPGCGTKIVVVWEEKSAP